MSYYVIKDFTDKVDKNVYLVGEKYPKSGRIKKARVEELLSLKVIVFADEDGVDKDE